MEEESGLPFQTAVMLTTATPQRGLMPGEVSPLESSQQQLQEKQLIHRVLDGQPELFYELIRPYERRVYAAALAILRDQADAEDAAQEAMLKALKHLRQFRAEAKFSTCLIQISVNEARMRRRKGRSDLMEPIQNGRDEEDSYSTRDFADWREIPSEVLERKEVREKLTEALAALGDDSLILAPSTFDVYDDLHQRFPPISPLRQSCPSP